MSTQYKVKTYLLNVIWNKHGYGVVKLKVPKRHKVLNAVYDFHGSIVVYISEKASPVDFVEVELAVIGEDIEYTYNAHKYVNTVIGNFGETHHIFEVMK